MNNDLKAALADYEFWRTSSEDWAKWLVEDLKNWRKEGTKEAADEVDSTLANLKYATAEAMKWMKKVQELNKKAA